MLQKEFFVVSIFLTSVWFYPSIDVLASPSDSEKLGSSTERYRPYTYKSPDDAILWKNENGSEVTIGTSLQEMEIVLQKLEQHKDLYPKDTKQKANVQDSYRKLYNEIRSHDKEVPPNLRSVEIFFKVVLFCPFINKDIISLPISNKFYPSEREFGLLRQTIQYFYFNWCEDKYPQESFRALRLAYKALLGWEQDHGQEEGIKTSQTCTIL